MNVIIASHNQGKVDEIKRLLVDYNITFQSLNDFPEIPEIEETGSTFEENARLKAETIAQQLNMLTLADDSGLVVPSLNGEPGVYSARYSGEGHDDYQNNLKLLENLAQSTSRDRSAYFVTCLVMAYPEAESLVVEGRVHGVIGDDLRGERGFGYDPLFYVPSKDKTFAEMSIEEKNKISHRANALKELQKHLPEWLKENKLNEDSSTE